MYPNDGMLLIFRKLILLVVVSVVLIAWVGFLVVYLSPQGMAEPHSFRISIDSFIIMMAMLAIIELAIGYVGEVDRLLNFREYEANVAKRIGELGGDAPTLMAEATSSSV